MKREITWNMLKGPEADVCISTENKKYKPTEFVKFLIFSLPAVLTCPFATAMCMLYCYARKAERAYPDALPSRKRNFRFTRSGKFTGFMIKAIHYICSLRNYRKAMEVVFRVHESGDFYNQAYVDAWIEICNACLDIPNLVFMAYTKSAEYFEKYPVLPANLVIRGSIWADTKPEQAEKLRRFPIYTACSAEEWEKLPEEQKCYCEDCAKCRKCWNSKCDIYVKIH